MLATLRAVCRTMCGSMEQPALALPSVSCPADEELLLDIGARAELPDRLQLIS